MRTSGRWSRVGTARAATQRGASIALATTQKIASASVTLRRCPTCGRAQVEWDGRAIPVSLRGRTGVVTVTFKRLARAARGTLRVRVTSTRGQVRVLGANLEVAQEQ